MVSPVRLLRSSLVSLRQIRSKIVASGKPLLNEEEIEKELASRRGGLQGRKE
ncbi:hypothetical protein [Anabaena catenula]|uniref:Uncharacterized protein n=1 Tax=Anabaena catenula FACHB-362 TaxID=2692877 RepID=A0ABR8J9F6_9NOST|nr:hypothetical protein [Anabaena catenula]MBD2693641.1 hypothetical protein [Anabaena catenula FACHB-362]